MQNMLNVAELYTRSRAVPSSHLLNAYLLLVLNELDKRNLLLLLAEWRRRRRRLFWWCFKFKILHPFSQSSVSQSESVTVIQTLTPPQPPPRQLARSFVLLVFFFMNHQLRQCEKLRRRRTQKDTKVSCSRLISHIVFVRRVRMDGCHRYYYCLYIFHGVPLNIFMRKMFSITTSSPIHTANKVFITCSFNILFKCEHVDDYREIFLGCEMLTCRVPSYCVCIQEEI